MLLETGATAAVALRESCSSTPSRPLLRTSSIQFLATASVIYASRAHLPQAGRCSGLHPRFLSRPHPTSSDGVGLRWANYCPIIHAYAAGACMHARMRVCAYEIPQIATRTPRKLPARIKLKLYQLREDARRPAAN
jgi:hypothetical protein